MYPIRAAVMTMALGGLIATVPAQAQMSSQGPGPTDPLIQQSEFDAGAHRFFLNNNQDTEIARFRSPHLLSICAGRGHMTPGGRVRGYALNVTWDTDTAMIGPGSCLSFEASRVKIRPATPLPQDIVLEGAYTIER